MLARKNYVSVNARLSKKIEGGLVDETAPGLPTAIAEHNSETVGNSGYGSAVGVAEGIAHRIFAHLFGRAAPYVAKLIAQAQVVPVTESIEARTGGFFLEVEKTPRYAAMHSSAFKDPSTDHQLYYHGFRAHFR
jgi:hypothetical protein